MEQQEKEIIKLYKSREKIQPKLISGFFQKWRWYFVIITQLVFYLTPWLIYNDRQAILFDLENRRFYLFGLLLYPQDLIYLTGLLIISALSLFLFTAVAGRLWCGYACPQTVYTEMFLWLENKIEGQRSARISMDKQELNLNKFLKRGAKHLSWLIVALWTGFTFVGYFTPIKELFLSTISFNLGPWQTFWIFFYSLATYGNAGWLREQVCKYMCPYARFQSAMFDKDTLIVTYDEKRGEPRGANRKKEKELNLGDCIDCKLCVQVCPTGIDIRNGLQYECIGCGACVDACDSVMDKISKPKGLVKYSTQNAMEQGWDKKQIWQKIKRKRIIIYSTILIFVSFLTFYGLLTKPSFKVDIIKDRNLAREVENGYIENTYRLQFLNAKEETQKYTLEILNLNNAIIEKPEVIITEAAQIKSYAISVKIPPGEKNKKYKIKFLIKNNKGEEIKEETTFIVPR